MTNIKSYPQNSCTLQNFWKTLQRFQGHERQGKIKQLPQKEEMKEKWNLNACGILDQEKHISGKATEILIKSVTYVLVIHQC